MSETEFSPSDSHWTNSYFKERVTKDELQELLLEHPDPIVAGTLKEWEHKKVGPGVYEIWIEGQKQ